MGSVARPWALLSAAAFTVGVGSCVINPQPEPPAEADYIGETGGASGNGADSGPSGAGGSGGAVTDAGQAGFGGSGGSGGMGGSGGSGGVGGTGGSGGSGGSGASSGGVPAEDNNAFNDNSDLAAQGDAKNAVGDAGDAGGDVQQPDAGADGALDGN